VSTLATVTAHRIVPVVLASGLPSAIDRATGNSVGRRARGYAEIRVTMSSSAIDSAFTMPVPT
jgi:hypothetical protein